VTVLDTLVQRNSRFAQSRFSAELKIMPSMKTIIIGCVDPRVDPVDIFGIQLGEAAIIRNVGGRITPAELRTIEMLSLVSKADGGELGPGWNLIVLHHTDCGITRLDNAPKLLAQYFGVTPAALPALAVNDPYASVVIDVAALKANPALAGAFLVTGLVYDVHTGRVETIVAPAPLRS
jgi:carbonic anhydrase